jgi:hypothetical protein
VISAFLGSIVRGILQAIGDARSGAWPGRDLIVSGGHEDPPGA